jgi:hypothetical protein
MLWALEGHSKGTQRLLRGVLEGVLRGVLRRTQRRAPAYLEAYSLDAQGGTQRTRAVVGCTLGYSGAYTHARALRKAFALLQA